MKRNSDRDKSNVDKVIYQRMIQRQEEKIRELEQELEKLDQ
ncbi:unknown [Prevotella sp. CAG:617]|nr:unknown [Prevotella sp. CAG:617]